MNKEEEEAYQKKMNADSEAIMSANFDEPTNEEDLKKFDKDPQLDLQLKAQSDPQLDPQLDPPGETDEERSARIIKEYAAKREATQRAKQAQEQLETFDPSQHENFEEKILDNPVIQEDQPPEPTEEELKKEEEQLKKRIRNLTRKDCNLFVDILENKYSERPISQPDDVEDLSDLYVNIYKNGTIYDDNDNFIITKYKHSNFNMTITRDSNLIEREYSGVTKNLIDNFLNDPNAPRIPLNDNMLEKIQFNGKEKPIDENNLTLILFNIINLVANELDQVNKISLNEEIIYDNNTTRSIIDKENLYNEETDKGIRQAKYYKYLTQLQKNVVNTEYRTEDNLLHKIYNKLNEVTSNIPDETFNKYFIDILTILIFFSDLTAIKLSQKIKNMFNVDERNISFKFSIARVIHDSNDNPIIQVSQGSQDDGGYKEDLLNIYKNTKKLSQLFGIEPSEVKNKLFTNTIEIFMEENADIIVTKTFTSFFYSSDDIYSLSLLNYTWNLNKNTCTIDLKYRWVIDDNKLSKIIDDYKNILTSILKIDNFFNPPHNYWFLKTTEIEKNINKYYNFKSYIENCIKMLKCVLKGEIPQELDGVSNNEFDYSASNQKIEGKIGQKWNKFKERYSEIVEDNPKKVMTAKAIGSVGTAVGLGVAGMAIAGVALSSVLGGKKSKKNMKRRNKKRVTKNYKKQNAKKKTRKGVKRAKKIRNTKKQRGKK
jgi:hypothetical protein